MAMLWWFGVPFGSYAQSTMNLSPKSVGGDGAFSTNTFAGRTVWVPNSTNNFLYFDAPGTFVFSTNQPVYLRIEYHDSGRGKLAVAYDSTLGSAYQSAEIHTRSSRVGGDQFVYSYQCFKYPLFAGRENGATDFRFKISGSDGTPLRVASAQISTNAYNDAQFTYALSQPWFAPYSGSTKDYVDTKSLSSKVLAGYQGWFATPNDVSDGGWIHWSRSSTLDPAPNLITVDQWPWLGEYETNRLYPAGNMVYQDGQSAYVFSSQDPETVLRHFRWMRKYNIDGVYLQRFVTRGNSGYYGASEFVLNNVRQAANQEGRVWAIEYDVSSLDTDTNAFQVITNDWSWLVNQCGILTDSRYLHENGKPVLFIWGFSVSGRNFTVSQADQIVSWFTNQNLYLIGGVSSSWQANTGWYGHYQKYDQLLGWMETSLSNLNSEKTQLNGWGMKILPHAWPGFSWNNLQQTVFPTDYTARNAGAFYWTRLYNSVSCGANQIFLGMFDEYNEGTAIMPMSDSHPDIYNAGGTNTWGHYVDNEGLDPFWYLRLSGAAKEMLNGQRTLSSVLPSSNTLPAVSFTGADATCYLGPTNSNSGLTHIQPGDGPTAGTLLGSQSCRTNGNLYYYFQLSDAFSVSNILGQAATIEIEYYDNVAGANIRVQYDSVTNAYTSTTSFNTTGSGGWKNYRWNVTNAFFGNRQNGGSDFRVALNTGKVIGVRRVSVFLPETTSGSPANTSPVLSPVSNRTLTAGQWLLITNTATDAEVPAQTLTFALPIAPAGAILNSSNGVLSWRPSIPQAPSSNPFTITVTDNGTPSLSATQSFTVTVAMPAAPQIIVPLWTNGQFRLSLSGDLGPDYTVETSADLVSWQALFTTNPISVPFFWLDRSASNSPMRFYRVNLGP